MKFVQWYEQNELFVYLVLSAALILMVAILAVFSRFKQSLHGEARFANRLEIRKAGLLNDAGIIVGKHRGSYLQFSGSQHVALLAPTRSGKGVSVVVPNLLTWPDSVVVLDVKQENFNITSQYRAVNGQDVYLVNPFDRQTHQYNPLAYLSSDPHERVAEVLSIGYMLYPRANRGETMWSDTARDLFVGLVLFQCETQETATLGEVLRQMSGKGQSVKDYMRALIESHILSTECVNALNRFINAPDNTAGGIITTAQAPLTLWASPIVDAATSANSFDLRDLRRRRMSVYIGIPVNKLPEAEVFLRLFFSQLINLNTGEIFGGEFKYPCLLVMDEFMAIGYMPIIDKSTSYLAGYGLRLMTIAQSKSMIAKPTQDGGYGREGGEALLDMHALNILFTPKNVKDSAEYSEILGYDTVKARSVQLRNRLQGSESDQRRALMLPQELLRLGQNTSILNLENVKPIKCRKIRYYSDRVFVERLQSVAPSLVGVKTPTEEQIKAAWPELRADVPTVDIDRIQAKAHNRTRSVTVADTKNGVDLTQLAIELPPAPTGTMSDSERVEYVDAFWQSLNPDTDETLIDLEGVDKSTGEVVPNIDMSVLRQSEA